MRVSIPIFFDVEAPNAEDEELTEQIAKEAAEAAAFDYLAFVEISGYSSDSAEVTTHVDGFGKCTVRLANDE